MHHNAASAAVPRSRRIQWALVLSSAYLIAEVVGGLLTGSLALLADAGHMLTDVGGLALALFAIRFAQRPADPARTYGYHRTEILAALVNAVMLLGVSAYILFEAWQRFRDPPSVSTGPMLAVAVIGLAVNLASMRLLQGGASDSLNVKGAYLEVVSDMLSSIGVIAAAGIMWATNWYYADPLVSAGIGVFIIPRTWMLLQQAVGVLLEGVPADVDLVALRAAVCKLEGVADAHDLHVWSLTTGVNALSVHVVRRPEAQHEDVLQRVHHCVTTEYRIAHATIQVESEACLETVHP